MVPRTDIGSGNRFGWLAIPLLVSLTLAAAAADPAPDADVWAKVRTPAPGKPEAIGLASGGCVSGAQALPLDGPGYRVMRPSRNRRFGHPELVGFVQALGRQIQERDLGTLLVGDLGQPRGGPMPSMHRSHQSGLDVDLWFWLPRDIGERTLSTDERERWSAPGMLSPNHRSLDPARWTPAQAALLQLAARHPEVDRIFVNPLIKQALCRSRAGSGWLRKLRPWWGHADHLHVRLRCPPGEGRCLSQDPLPAGDGCDTSLAWWFTDEARQRPSGPPGTPTLPAACLALIDGG